jgi:hypothetical protein
MNCSLPSETRESVPDFENDISHYRDLIRLWLAKFTVDVPQWDCISYPEYNEGLTQFEPLEYITDSGLYVFHFMGFDMHDVPPIFTMRDIARIRKNTAFLVLKGSFPI